MVPAEIDHHKGSCLASPAPSRIVRVAFDLVNHNSPLLMPALGMSILHALAISTIVLSHHSRTIIQRTLNKCYD